MNGKTFVDTNVLIYAHDADAPAKHQIANAVLRELWSERTGVLSLQVLQEFYVNVTRKIATPISKESARLIVKLLQSLHGNYSAEISAAFGSRRVSNRLLGRLDCFICGERCETDSSEDFGAASGSMEFY